MTADDLTIIITAGLVATAAGLLGPFLVLRRVALMSDAVSHAVLPGIVAVYLLFGTRAPLPVILGAGLFAVLCVIAIDWLRATRLVASDAAIALVFPALFALGVLGVTKWASGAHLDLDATIYGEIAFAPFETVSFAGVEVARSIVLLGGVALANGALVALLWKELKATTFDPEFARTIGISPVLLSRLLLIAVAVTAVTAFESVGAILVVTLLIVPAATAYLLADRIVTMIAVTLAIGWFSAIAGHTAALQVDASIAGAMGLVASCCFVLALLLSPKYGLLARRRQRGRRRREVREALAAR
ncbi:metal ABC transporter permease [Conexibacter stalactiti]|uniref:Metal ABC transporter permease n=1 Tax=Conexibacter stalactiti TaxID=1940611 RepID=A0ABU4HYC4_9ACTN|nr:metal ABC transporter permease [Conexibacter stalactiti]MDW5598228.1 metal ABC transporter permease [Conexibacter stalactiti]MEC5038870.1 metal ABC transporter permease [Conexibacter stalactiti]